MCVIGPTILTIKIKKSILALLLIAIVCLIFSGCTDQTYEITINEDNSCDMTLSLITDSDNYNLLTSYQINLDNKLVKKESSLNPVEQCDVIFQEAAAVFYTNGFEITPVSDAVQIGFTAKKHYPNIESLNKDIKKLYDSKVFGLNIEIDSSDTFMYKSYNISGSLEYFQDPDFEIPDEMVSSLEGISDTTSVSANLIISFPGKAKSETGKVSTSGVSWQAKPKEKPVEIGASSKLTNTKAILIIAIPVVIVIGVIVVIIARKLKIAKEKKQGSLQ